MRPAIALVSAAFSGMAAYQISRHGDAFQIGMEVAGAVYFALFVLILPRTEKP